MLVYGKRIFECHLDKSPAYSFPQSAQHALSDVPGLAPEISAIQIHHHGSESAIAIEGSHLWFCYGVSFRGEKLSIPASDVSGSSVQFNGVVLPTDSELLAYRRENISLDNHF